MNVIMSGQGCGCMPGRGGAGGRGDKHVSQGRSACYIISTSCVRVVVRPTHLVQRWKTNQNNICMTRDGHIDGFKPLNQGGN